MAALGSGSRGTSPPTGILGDTKVEKREQGRVVPTHLDVVSKLQGTVLSLVSQVDAVQVLWEWQDQHPQVLAHMEKSNVGTLKKPPKF